MKIPSDERVALVGQTGSGKTFFAKHMLAASRRLIVCDAKGEITASDDWDLQPFDQGIRDLERGKPARLLVPPLLDDDEWEAVFRKIYSLRYVRVYIDEMYNVGPPRGSRALRALYTQGRSKHISMWGSSQRPRFIPGFTLSEAGWVIMFRLQLSDDMDFMARNFIGPAALKPLHDHQLIVKQAGEPAYKFDRLKA